VIANLQKLQHLLKHRGLVHVVKFLLGRAVCRFVSRVVYDISLCGPRPPVQLDKGEEVVVYEDRNRNAIPEELYRFLGGPAADEYLRGLAHGDALFVLKRGSEYLHFSYIFMKTRQTRIVGEPGPVPLLGNAFTARIARGQGIHLRMLNARLNWLFARGHSRAVVETALDNHASRRGIERSGFTLLRTMKGVIIFNKIAVQSIYTSARRSIRIWMV
jgi:GNAT superfamily N-acetyltransferase